MSNLQRKPPLARVAANNKAKNTIAANHKQFYGLRKDINQLIILLSKLCDQNTKDSGGYL